MCFSSSSSYPFISSSLCDLTRSPSSLDHALFFHLSPLSWSQVTVTTQIPPPHPPILQPALTCRSKWMVGHKNGLTTLWLALGQRQHWLSVLSTQTTSLLTHPTSTYSDMYPDRDPTTVARSPLVWYKEVTGLTVSPRESLQWDSTEWYLAWLCLQEVKPYLGPDSNPVFSRTEVELTASVREENHAGNLSHWGWTVTER